MDGSRDRRRTARPIEGSARLLPCPDDDDDGGGAWHRVDVGARRTSDAALGGLDGKLSGTRGKKKSGRVAHYPAVNDWTPI